MNITLNTMQDVAEFTNAMYKLDFNYHPDNWFGDYISYETGLPLFTPQAAQVYQTCVMRCFEICKWAKIDYYEFCSAFRGIGREDVVCTRFMLQYRNAQTGQIETYNL